jgi:hypothetical protein
MMETGAAGKTIFKPARTQLKTHVTSFDRISRKGQPPIFYL